MKTREQVSLSARSWRALEMTMFILSASSPKPQQKNKTHASVWVKVLFEVTQPSTASFVTPGWSLSHRINKVTGDKEAQS
jgi:hypothetical protein